MYNPCLEPMFGRWAFRLNSPSRQTSNAQLQEVPTWPTSWSGFSDVLLFVEGVLVCVFQMSAATCIVIPKLIVYIRIPKLLVICDTTTIHYMTSPPSTMLYNAQTVLRPFGCILFFLFGGTDASVWHEEENTGQS